LYVGSAVSALVCLSFLHAIVGISKPVNNNTEDARRRKLKWMLGGRKTKKGKK
jgi:hypothetical protein